MHLERPYEQKLLIPILVGGFCSLERTVCCKRGRTTSGKVRGRRKNLRYFVTVVASKECTISIAPESHHDVFYSDEEKARLRKIAKLEEINLQRESVFFEEENVQYAGRRQKGKRGLRYHLYLVLEDAYLKISVPSMYADSMQHVLRTNARLFWLMRLHSICLMRKELIIVVCPRLRTFSDEMTGERGENCAMSV